MGGKNSYVAFWESRSDDEERGTVRIIAENLAEAFVKVSEWVDNDNRLVGINEEADPVIFA